MITDPGANLVLISERLELKEEFGGIATCLLPGGAFETMKVDSITLTGD